jgi:hypothetical protein
MDYKHDCRIDETSLDIEWLNQAELSIQYGEYWAICRRKLTESEEKIKVIRAGLIKEANDNPMKCCKKDKPTVTDIEAYYRTHPEHIKAKNDWVQTQYDCDIAEVAKNEIGFTRKLALENLVRLHGQSYFAGPSVPRNLNEERYKNIPVKISPPVRSK